VAGSIEEVPASVAVVTAAGAEHWTDPHWLAGAYEWIEARLAETGAARVGPIEQPHVRLWATVLKIPTDQGLVWFKANGGSQAYEAGVVAVLARVRPDAVPGLLAVDRERAWMLMADGGTRLRELVESERDLSRWFDVLPRYGELQLDVAQFRDDLLRAGAPDRGLDALPGLYERLLAVGSDRVPADELVRLRKLIPWVAEGCRELASLGVPETIQHDDLHDGQVFVRDGAYLFFDWGDSCVSHPFLTMSVTLEGVLSWGLDDVENSVDIAPLRDAYLRPFERFGSADQREAGFAIALRLGWICRSLDYQATRQSLGPEHAEEYGEAVAVRLRMFLEGFSAENLAG
jgi:hypothetical protein